MRQQDRQQLRDLAEYRRCMAAVKDSKREAEQREHTAKCRKEALYHELQRMWLARAWV